jgi:hypothetical protein
MWFDAGPKDNRWVQHHVTVAVAKPTILITTVALGTMPH